MNKTIVFSLANEHHRRRNEFMFNGYLMDVMLVVGCVCVARVSHLKTHDLK